MFIVDKSRRQERETSENYRIKTFCQQSDSNQQT